MSSFLNPFEPGRDKVHVRRKLAICHSLLPVWARDLAFRTFCNAQTKSLTQDAGDIYSLLSLSPLNTGSVYCQRAPPLPSSFAQQAAYSFPPVAMAKHSHPFRPPSALPHHSLAQIYDYPAILCVGRTPRKARSLRHNFLKCFNKTDRAAQTGHPSL